MIIKPNAITLNNYGGSVVLSVGVPHKYAKDLETLAQSFQVGQEWELKQYKTKRSLSANAFCWVLCDEIAKVLHCEKEDVYRQAIGHVGVFTELQFSTPEAMDKFKRIWQHNGVGWLTRTVDETTLHAFAGSSTYKRDEMSRVLDFLVEEAKGLGIQTKPREEIEALLKQLGD